jgi:hypothetical protein
MENENKKAEEKVKELSLIPKAIAQLVLKEEYEKGMLRFWKKEVEDKVCENYDEENDNPTMGNHCAACLQRCEIQESIWVIAHKIAAIAFEEGFTCLAETKGIDLDDPTPPKTVIEYQ